MEYIHGIMSVYKTDVQQTACCQTVQLDNIMLTILLYNTQCKHSF